MAKRARVVVVSNVIWRGRDALRRDFEHFGLASHISEYLTSLDDGWRTPDGHIFETALGVGGTPPEQCLMVGNSEVNDIVPAIRLGVTVIRVAIEEPKPSASAANHVFMSLEQMTDFLVSQHPFRDLPLPPSQPGKWAGLAPLAGQCVAGIRRHFPSTVGAIRDLEISDEIDASFAAQLERPDPVRRKPRNILSERREIAAGATGSVLASKSFFGR